MVNWAYLRPLTLVRAINTIAALRLVSTDQEPANTYTWSRLARNWSTGSIVVIHELRSHPERLEDLPSRGVQELVRSRFGLSENWFDIVADVGVICSFITYI